MVISFPWLYFVDFDICWGLPSAFDTSFSINLGRGCGDWTAW
jgi:hypothetical protein